MIRYAIASPTSKTRVIALIQQQRLRRATLLGPRTSGRGPKNEGETREPNKRRPTKKELGAQKTQRQIGPRKKNKNMGTIVGGSHQEQVERSSNVGCLHRGFHFSNREVVRNGKQKVIFESLSKKAVLPVPTTANKVVHLHGSPGFSMACYWGKKIRARGSPCALKIMDCLAWVTFAPPLANKTEHAFDWFGYEHSIPFGLESTKLHHLAQCQPQRRE